jgi:hypothetical protein
MAITCPKCGAEFDATLFDFGHRVRCDCGAEVEYPGTGLSGHVVAREVETTGVGQQGFRVTTVPLKIVRCISEEFPGFVAGELVDAYGRTHTFVDKGPVIAGDYLTAESGFPCAGVLACEIMQQWTSDDGRELVRITTERPWDVPSTENEYQFVVLAEQLIVSSNNANNSNPHASPEANTPRS